MCVCVFFLYTSSADSSKVGNHPLNPLSFLPHGSATPVTYASYMFLGHTQTHHTGQDSSRRVISPMQIPLPDNSQHSQETVIHPPRGIRTRNPSKRAAADPRLGPHGFWDRPPNYYNTIIFALQLCSYKNEISFKNATVRR